MHAPELQRAPEQVLGERQVVEARVHPAERLEHPRLRERLAPELLRAE